MPTAWTIKCTIATGVFAIAFSGGAQATTVDWTGNDAFNNSGNSTTFLGFVADQLTSITGPGTYEASLSQKRPFDPVPTTFTLAIDLNNVWTTILTWTSDSSNEQLLSDLATPIDFAKGLVTGLRLSADPPGTSRDPTYDNFASFGDWNWWDCNSPGEQFIFSDVATTPLPSTLPLFVGGLCMLWYIADRRKRNLGRPTAVQ